MKANENKEKTRRAQNNFSQKMCQKYLSLQIVDFLAKIVEHVFPAEEFGEQIAQGGAEGGQHAAQSEAGPKAENGARNDILTIRDGKFKD